MDSGVSVFSYQALENAVAELAGLFNDIDVDAMDEAKLPGVYTWHKACNSVFVVFNGLFDPL